MKFNHSAHVRLWNGLIENPHADKKDWEEWEKWEILDGIHEGILIANGCFACSYTLEASGLNDPNTNPLCHLCPLDWKDDTRCGSNSLYNKWTSEKDVEKRKEYAYLIRDLKVKEGIETI